MAKSLPVIKRKSSGVKSIKTRKTAGERGYNSSWRKARLAHLSSNPLCVYCKREGIIRTATVVDHIIPHKGDSKLFWDKKNWQSLCKKCHDSTKQKEERVKYG